MDRDLTREHIATREHHPLNEFKQEEGPEEILDTVHDLLLP